MPWTAEDAEKHTKKADTPKKREVWAKVANSALKRCEDKNQGNCEARAIKQADAVVARMSEAWEEDFEQWFEGLDEETQGLVLLNVHGLKSALDSERELRKEAQHHIREVAALLGEATKTDDGKVYTASDYVYVPDADKPDTWKLRISEYVGGKKQVTAKMIGAAISALSPGGHRGKKAQIPSDKLPAIKARLRSLWKKYNPDKDPDEMPGHIKEGEDFSGDAVFEGAFVPLVEKSVRQDGTIPVKIIGPGWGNTGYYAPDILERDGPRVFKAGTKMFWDHQTEDELAARPEGSLRNLAGELTSDARWESGNVLGPGLYADAKVFSGFKGAVDELAPHIGVSILGVGKAKEGEADGRAGPVIQEISAVRSVDFVTMPGAGGKILQIFESARSGQNSKSEDMKMSEEIRKLEEAKRQLEADLKTATDARIAAEKAKTEAEDENAKLKEAVLLREAKDFVSGKLAEAELPDLTKDRLVESLSMNPPLKDGKIDEEAYAKKLEEAVKAEAEYLAKVLGSGTIRGMGAAGGSGGDEEGHQALKESFKSKYLDEGMSPEQAEAMAEIAAAGR